MDKMKNKIIAVDFDGTLRYSTGMTSIRLT